MIVIEIRFVMKHDLTDRTMGEFKFCVGINAKM